MSLLIEVPEEVAVLVRAAAESQGMDVNAFAVAVLEDAAYTEPEEPDADLVVAFREGLADLADGRSYTLEEVNARFGTDLAAAQAQVRAILQGGGPLPPEAIAARDA